MTDTVADESGQLSIDKTLAEQTGVSQPWTLDLLVLDRQLNEFLHDMNEVRHDMEVFMGMIFCSSYTNFLPYFRYKLQRSLHSIPGLLHLLTFHNFCSVSFLYSPVTTSNTY